jgi:uncharacterized protein
LNPLAELEVELQQIVVGGRETEFLPLKTRFLSKILAVSLLICINNELETLFKQTGILSTHRTQQGRYVLQSFLGIILPMKVLLISDTHGYFDPALAERFANVEMILHAGDVGTEAVLTHLRAIAPTVAVRGNVDGGGWGRELPLETVVEVGSLRIAMLHIAGNPKKPHADALALIRREQPDILLVGHSHIPVIERAHGTLWVNPGAAGNQGWHPERTCMLLQIGAERTIDLMSLGKR